MEINKTKVDYMFERKTKGKKYEKELNEVHEQLRTLREDEVLEIKDVNDKLLNAIRCSLKNTTSFNKDINKVFTTRTENNNMYIKIKQ